MPTCWWRRLLQAELAIPFPSLPTYVVVRREANSKVKQQHGLSSMIELGFALRHITISGLKHCQSTSGERSPSKPPKSKASWRNILRRQWTNGRLANGHNWSVDHVGCSSCVPLQHACLHNFRMCFISGLSAQAQLNKMSEAEAAAMNRQDTSTCPVPL